MALVVQNPKIKEALKRPLQEKKTEMPIGDSSFLQKVSYDATAQSMTVTMKNGSQYVYSQVNPGMMENFMQAQNKGEYYSRVVKKTLGGSQRIVDKTVGKAVPGASEKKRRTKSGFR